MASFVFDQVKEFAISGTLNFNNVADGTYRVALMVSDVVDDPSLYSPKKYWSEISQFEIVNYSTYNNDGYPGRNPYPDSKPGNVLKGVKIEDNPAGGGDDGLMDKVAYAKNISYNVSTIDADCVIIMKISSKPNDYDLIAAIDIRVDGQSVKSNNGVFSLLFDLNSGGFLTVK